MSNKIIKELQPTFKALKKAKKILGEEMYNQIIRKIIRGALAEEERDFLQNKRRDAAAAYLGMNRTNYEKMLEGKPYLHKMNRKLNDKKTIREFLGL